MKDIDLASAFPPTPDSCRDAVARAVRSYEEERTMRKRYIPALAALLVMLLCGTAYAISVFSVGDVIDAPSKAFTQQIVPIENTKTSHGLTVTLGDAVFDGTYMMASLQMETAEGMTPVYVYPRVQAQANGQPLGLSDGFIEADCPDPTNYTTKSFGQMYPSLDAAWPAPEKMLCKAFLYEAINQPVEWTVSLNVYTPNWPLMDSSTIPITDRDDYFEVARAIYEQGCIATSYGDLDVDWIDWAQLASENNDDPAIDILVKSGAFTLADTLTFTFTTPCFQAREYAVGGVYPMDGYTIELRRLRQTFMKLEYELIFRYDECQIPEGSSAKMAGMEIDDAFLPEGMTFRSGSSELADDGMTAVYIGEVQYISDEPLTELTFTLDPKFTSRKYEVYPSFTVKLDK